MEGSQNTYLHGSLKKLPAEKCAMMFSTEEGELSVIELERTIVWKAVSGGWVK